MFFDDESIAFDVDGNSTADKYLYDDDTPVVRVKRFLGADDQVASSDLISDAASKWTSAHRLRGNAYAYVRIGWKEGLWPNGIPNISFVVQGKSLFDTRTQSTPASFGINPALMVYDYLRNSLYGLNVPASEIDTGSFDTAANVCEESVSLLAGGSEDRYAGNGILDTAATPKVVLEELLSSMAGVLTYQNGKWFVYSGEYRTPTVSLDEGDLRGGISVTTLTSRKDLFNTVRGIYIDPNSNYQPVDFPEVTNSTFVTEDNNDIIVHDTTYPFTTSAPTCQRLAKVELERVRQQIRIDIPLKLTGFQLQVGDTFQFSNDRFGWVNKVFEVDNWVLVLVDDGNGSQTPGVNISAKETASSVWSWSTEETTVEAAPDTDLPDPYVVADMSGLALDSSEDQLIRGANGRIVTRIKATWTAPTDNFVLHGGFIEVYSKLSTEVTYTLADTVPGRQAFAFITDVDDRSLYDIRIRARNYIGSLSAYHSVATHTVIGKTTPPPNVQNFNASTNLGLARFQWTALDIVDVYGYEIRYGIPGTQWQNATPLTVAKQGTSETTTAVPPGTWSFLIKAKDYVGLLSNAAAVAGPLTVSNVNVVLNAIDDGEFPGTLDNMIQHYTGVLAPESQSLASDHGFSTFDVFTVTPEVECIYTSPEIDLTTDKDVRVWGNIESALGPGMTEGIANPTLQICYRAAADAGSGDDITSELISASGTFTNCILHYTGVITPDSQSLADAVGFEVFDQFVYDPYEIAIYEGPEVDYGADNNQKLDLVQGFQSGPGETGNPEVLVEIDTHTTSNSYDGFEAFTANTFNLRFAKLRVTLNSVTTVSKITDFELIAGCWRDWIIGDIENVRYIQARINLDTTVGVAKITDFNWTIDELV